MANIAASKMLAPASQATLKLIESQSDVLSDKITTAYFEKHPECRGTNEYRIRRICREDMGHHLAFFYNAMRTGVPEVFSNYLVWLKNALISRNLDTSHTSDALQLMKQLLDEMLPEADRDKADAILQIAIEEFETTTDALVSYAPPHLLKLDSTDAYTQALISSNRNEAGNIIMQEMDSGTSFADISVGIIQPALYEIGRLWQVNQITVAQEHLATAISQNVLAKAYARADFKVPIERRALFACIENNYHSLGLLMVSDAFEVEGWSVTYLGENTPTGGLIRMLDASPVDLLGLSISMHEQVAALSDDIEKIQLELGSRCPTIAVGGLPLNAIPGLALRLKADIWFPNAKIASREAK